MRVFTFALTIVFAFSLAASGVAFGDEGLTTGGSTDIAGDGAGETQQDESARDAESAARKVVSDGLYLIGSTAYPKQAIAVSNGSKRAKARAGLATRNVQSWAQKWIVTWDKESGYYKIRNLNSRLFLTVSGTVKAKAAVVQRKASQSRSQLWEVVKKAGKVAFKPAGSNYALAVTGKTGALNLRLAAFSETAALKRSQAFKLRAVEALEANRTYYINSVASGKRLHVANGSVAGGAKLDLAKAASSKSQKFRILKYGASSYRLQNVQSTYYAGVGSSKKGTVRQFAGKSGASRKWKVSLDLASGCFTIGSKQAGKRLASSSGGLSMRAAERGKAQLFTLSKTYAFKVYLNPGHGQNSSGNGVWDSGAVGNGHQEAEFTHDLAKRVVEHLESSDVKVVNGEQYHLAYWLRLPKAVRLGCDVIVSLHFDAGGGSGTLAMIGGQGGAAGSKALGGFIHKQIVSSLGLPDRGWSHRSDITCVNGSIPSYLAEVCYMDTAGDVQRYLGKRDAVARGIAKGIVKASRSRSVMRHCR